MALKMAELLQKLLQQVVAWSAQSAAMHLGVMRASRKTPL
jgi:hypothetical protein